MLLDPSTSPIGIDTTLFCMLLLLFLGEGAVAVVLKSSPESGESGPFSDELWGSSCSLVKYELVLCLFSITIVNN